MLHGMFRGSNREAPNLALLTPALEQQHLHQLFRIVPTQQKAAGPTRWSFCTHIVRQDTVKRKEWELLCFWGTATMLLAVMVTCLFFSPGTRARSKHRQVGDLKSFKKRQLCLIVRDPPFPQMTVEVAAGVEDCFFLPEVKSGQTIEMEFQVFFRP